MLRAIVHTKIIGLFSKALMRYIAWYVNDSWWGYQRETFSALLVLSAGSSPVIGEFPYPSVNSPLKDQWCGALMFSLICAWTTDWVNNRHASELRRHWAHYYVTVMGSYYPLRIWIYLPNLTMIIRAVIKKYWLTTRDPMTCFLAILPPISTDHAGSLNRGHYMSAKRKFHI